MRIGMITQWYDPELGPAALPAVLARELVRRGASVKVLTGFLNYFTGSLAHGYRLQPRMHEPLDGVRVTRTFPFPSQDDCLVRRLSTYASFGASAAALGLKSLTGVDAVWVNCSPMAVALPMLVQRHLQGTPIATEVADPWPDTIMVSGVGAGFAVRKVAAPLLAMYRASDAIVHIAPSVGQVLQNRGGSAQEMLYIPQPAKDDVFRLGGDPRQAPRLLRAPRYRGHSVASAPGAALLSSICVHPKAQGQGVGALLIQAWTDEIALRGVTAALRTTDPEGNDHVTTFYPRPEWVRTETSPRQREDQ